MPQKALSINARMKSRNLLEGRLKCRVTCGVLTGSIHLGPAFRASEGARGALCAWSLGEGEMR